MIWVAQSGYLRDRHHDVPYSCSARSYSRLHLQRELKDGIILLSGGGDFGDIWPEQQRFREQVIRDFPNNQIIQLPQTVCFRGPKNRSRARDAVQSHPALTIMVRDRTSLERTQRELEADALLCPDVAFLLPTQVSECVDGDILWLARTDHESAHPPSSAGGHDLRCIDWVPNGPAIRHPLLSGLRPRLAGGRLWPDNWPTATGSLSGKARGWWEALAHRRIRWAVAQLGSAQVVITDRLHAHILCLLLGRPHVLLDDRFGKLSTFFETWTHTASTAVWADSATAALRAAHDLLETANP
jgi:pyruvyl transferase EpsO